MRQRFFHDVESLFPDGNFSRTEVNVALLQMASAWYMVTVSADDAAEGNCQGFPWCMSDVLLMLVKKRDAKCSELKGYQMARVLLRGINEMITRSVPWCMSSCHCTQRGAQMGCQRGPDENIRDERARDLSHMPVFAVQELRWFLQGNATTVSRGLAQGSGKACTFVWLATQNCCCLCVGIPEIPCECASTWLTLPKLSASTFTSTHGLSGCTAALQPTVGVVLVQSAAFLRLLKVGNGAARLEETLRCLSGAQAVRIRCNSSTSGGRQYAFVSARGRDWQLWFLEELLLQPWFEDAVVSGELERWRQQR
ncbi:hypothetical protein MTO96_034026 [Rhipicephalus appendiculatus]